MDNIHLQRYITFIDSRKKRVLPENIYCEVHHIIPRALGGGNEPNNLIKLSLREHYIAHLILWKAYGHKMALAFRLMSNHYLTLTSRQFEALRKDCNLPKSEETKAKMRAWQANGKNPMKGKHLSEERKQRLREMNSGSNHPQFGRRGELSARGRKIRCIESGIIYGSALEAERQLNLFEGSIYRFFRGKLKSTKGYHWEKLE